MRLAIYLNDHLAGATAGLELARRVHGSNADGDYGPALAEVTQEIAEDRESLLEIMRRLNIGRDPLKVTAAWIGEKLGRFKLNGQIAGYSPLSRLEELEFLSLGVEGKRALWSALREVYGERLADVELDPLIARADRQRAVLEELRLQASRAAFDT
jgi:hypothetical protein